MKQTVLVDKRLVAELKSIAAAERRTLASVTQEVVRLGFAARRKRRHPQAGSAPHGAASNEQR